MEFDILVFYGGALFNQLQHLANLLPMVGNRLIDEIIIITICCILTISSFQVWCQAFLNHSN
jgi:hypothetical protein